MKELKKILKRISLKFKKSKKHFIDFNKKKVFLPVLKNYHCKIKIKNF